MVSANPVGFAPNMQQHKREAEHDHGDDCQCVDDPREELEDAESASLDSAT